VGETKARPYRDLASMRGVATGLPQLLKALVESGYRLVKLVGGAGRHELPLRPLSLWPTPSNSTAGVRQQHAQLGLRSDHDGTADHQQMCEDENGDRREQFHCGGVRW
jgi:hypothetical protein